VPAAESLLPAEEAALAPPEESIIPADAVRIETPEADAMVEEKLQEPIIEPLAPPYRVVLWFKYDELRAEFDKFWKENADQLIWKYKLKGKKGAGGVMKGAQKMAESRVPLKALYQQVLGDKIANVVPDVLLLEGFELFNFEKGQTPHMVGIIYFYPKITTLREPINWACKKPKEPSRQVQFEARLRELQMQFRKLEDDPDGAITMLSNIQMDVIASIEGKPYANGSFQRQWVDISGIPMKDLVEQLIGHKVGDLFECDYLASPRDQENVGKTVHAAIKIHNLQKIVIPPVDDELARDAEFDDLKSFEDRFHQDFDAFLRRAQRGLVADHVIGHIVQNSTVPPIPQGYINGKIVEMAQQHLRQFGGNKNAAMRAIGAQSEEDFIHRFTGQAYRGLMQELAARKYGELFSVAPGSDEMFESMLDNVKWVNEEEKP
jgi:FKBP-type peptidyl-prolyl cis-trans isomerase (trigger factor)